MSGRRLTKIVGMLVLATLGTARLAQATTVPLTLDNSWVVLDDVAKVPFFFTGTGIGSPTQAGATGYTWTSPNTVEFDLTDTFVLGDGFTVFDNGFFVTNVAGKPDWTTLGGGCTATHVFEAVCHFAETSDAAWADPLFNQARLFFAPGSHVITIEDIVAPQKAAGDGVFPDGTVTFRAEAAVPEPASLVLFGSGLIGIAMRVRRRKRS